MCNFIKHKTEKIVNRMDDQLRTNRKGRTFVSRDERARFIEAVKSDSRPYVQTFALTLAYTGSRISEALALRICDVNISDATIQFLTLKKYSEHRRTVPIPSQLARDLDLTHVVRNKQMRKRRVKEKIWKFSRSTGFRYIRELMEEANISGPHANPKGIRHGYGIAAVEAGIPLPIITELLGHSSLQTTAVYTSAAELDIRTLLSSMWDY